MQIMEIIKESFVFPSKDIGKLAIYIVLSIVISFLGLGGMLSFIMGVTGSEGLMSLIGFIIFIAALILGFVISGYYITIIKSGIDHEESAPAFEWTANLLTGIKNLIVSIVYMIIPALIVSIVGLLTNVPGNLYAVLQQSVASSVNATATANATVPAVSAVSDALMGNLISSLAITGVVALVLFILFGFIETMGQARLANTDSLSDALNIIEAFKDIGRIGWGKVVATVILIVIIILAINVIIGLIAYYVPALEIISIIVTPYLTFFAANATGLLYSDIA